MKTTIDIPDEELKMLMKFTNAKTKREAVVYAIKDFNKRQRMSQLTDALGTFQDFMAQIDLKKMREDKP